MYCFKCGTKLDETGKCQKCDTTTNTQISQSMSPNQQEDVVKKALDLSTIVYTLNEKLLAAKAEQYEEPPTPPTHDVIKKEKYPDVKTESLFNYILCFAPLSISIMLLIISAYIPDVAWILAIFLFVLGIPGSAIWAIIYTVAIYLPKKKAAIAKIKESDEYKQECSRIDEEYNAKVVEADARYEEEISAYNNGPLAEYNRKCSDWQKSQNEKIESIQIELNENAESLSDLYSTSRLIPPQYRTIDRLEYIYKVMSTTDYTVKEAIEMYDREQQRILDSAKLQEMQISNQNAEIQNELLNEQNIISENARREANIAAIIATVQRHNTNRYLRNR